MYWFTYKAGDWTGLRYSEKASIKCNVPKVRCRQSRTRLTTELPNGDPQHALFGWTGPVVFPHFEESERRTPDPALGWEYMGNCKHAKVEEGNGKAEETAGHRRY